MYTCVKVSIFTFVGGNIALAGVLAPVNIKYIVEDPAHSAALHGKAVNVVVVTVPLKMLVVKT